MPGHGDLPSKHAISSVSILALAILPSQELPGLLEQVGELVDIVLKALRVWRIKESSRRRGIPISGGG